MSFMFVSFQQWQEHLLVSQTMELVFRLRVMMLQKETISLSHVRQILGERHKVTWCGTIIMMVIPLPSQSLTRLQRMDPRGQERVVNHSGLC